MAFNNGQVWTARQAAITICAASTVTVTALANLASFWSTTPFTLANAKNVTITLPTVTADAVPMVGVDANSFQNLGMERKPVGATKLTATLVLDADEAMEAKVLTATAITSAVAASRYHAEASQTDVAILVTLTATVATANDTRVSFGLARCIVGFGDVKVTADGHVEQDIEAYCLPVNTHIEYYD